MIPIFKPFVDQEEIDAVAEVINSKWIGLGPKTKEFEKKFAEYIGCKYAISLNSGTAALHLALKVLNFKQGSEIITTPLTFISTAFAANYNNLMPVFGDIQEDTLNLSPKGIKDNLHQHTRAIIPVHFGGHPCDMKEIKEIADENDLIIVEDTAHAMGSSYNGKKIGSFSTLSCFSFHAVKNLTTADGGMITTNNKEYYEELKKIRWLGIDRSTFARSEGEYKWDYDVNDFGFKYHGNDILSALGLVQLKKIDKANELRRNIFKRYNEELNLDWIKTPIHKEHIVSSCHNYVIKIDKNREEFIKHLNKNNISAGVHYKPLYLHKVYQNIKAKCPVTDNIWKKLVTLPLFPSMTEQEINQVITAVKSFSARVRKNPAG